MFLTSVQDCRKRWFHSLDPSLRKGRWTEEEDDKLVDNDLLEVLSRVGLKDKVLSWDGGLDADFDPEGSLSHGERQLFCLARAMLKISNIVILDEFTSR